MMGIGKGVKEAQRGGPRAHRGGVICGLMAGVLAALAVAGTAAAGVPAPGDLDRHFAGTGQATLDSQSYDSGKAVALDAQHRIVVAGWTTAASGGNFSGDFLVARYLPDGN